MRTITSVTTLTLIILTIVMLARAPFSGAPAASVTDADTARETLPAPRGATIAVHREHRPVRFTRPVSGAGKRSRDLAGR
ncbi:hypothetical protein [Chloroflexus sp.]|uniref:hypothetical protein n=1 Tax=Chloroflexus sp. TaxID=1904827 RepID=UPI002ACD942A|nr:hypothetical protein [Chloroflexus sp.]